MTLKVLGRRLPLALAAVGLLLGGCASSGLEDLPPPGGAHKIGPSDVDDQTAQLLRMAEGAKAGGEIGVAAGFYGQAHELNPENGEIALLFGDAVLAKGQPAAAAKAAAGVLEREPGSLAAAKLYAKAMLTTVRPKTVAPRLEPLLARHPDDVELINLLGVAHDLLGRHDDALKLYRHGLRIDPASVALRTNYGLSLALAGDTQGGIEVLQPLADGADSSARIRQNLAIAHALAGDMAAAERIGRIDLGQEAVETNLAYFQALKDGPAPSPAAAPLASAITRPQQQLLTVAKSPQPPTVARRSPQPQPSMTTAEPRPRPASAAPQPAAAAPPALDVAAGAAGVALGRPAGGAWVIDLGRFADADAAAAHWDDLAQRRPEAVRGLRRLAGGARLLIGPFPSEAGAGAACTALQADACRPVRL